MSDPAETSTESETPETILADILSRSGTDEPETATSAPVVTEREAAPPPAAEKTPSAGDLAMARIAALDAELAAIREDRKREAAARASEPPAKARRTSITAEDLKYNPNAALAELGINKEVLAQFMVAEHAGPNAPVDFRVQAALMPHMGALRESMIDEVSSVKRRLEEYEAREADRTLQDSMHKAVSGISSDKFPTLARALAADRDGTVEDLIKVARDAAKAAGGTPGGSIEAALTQAEAFYATLAKRLAPAPAASTQGSSSKPAPTTRSAPPATMANLSGPPPTKSSGLTHEEELARLRDEILSRTSA